MKGLILLFICSIFCFVACNDDLPEPTQNGANTFGCLINGEPWTPEVDGFNETAIDALFYWDADGSASLSMTATRDLDNSTKQFIKVNFRTDDFIVGEKYPIRPGMRNHNGLLAGDCRWIEVDTALYNEVSITNLDQDKMIISGTFRYTCREDECPEEIMEITKGRFDVKYRQ